MSKGKKAGVIAGGAALGAAAGLGAYKAYKARPARKQAQRESMLDMLDDMIVIAETLGYEYDSIEQFLESLYEYADHDDGLAEDFGELAAIIEAEDEEEHYPFG